MNEKVNDDSISRQPEQGRRIVPVDSYGFVNEYLICSKCGRIPTIRLASRVCPYCGEKLVSTEWGKYEAQNEHHKKDDPVNHPAHYTDGRIEVIEFIEDKRLGYCLGNAVKYISRAGKKDPAREVEDLQKAVWYIERRIKELTDADRDDSNQRP